MLQRRWFHYLKNAVSHNKALRKMSTDAAIFRFLSLQRKGLQQWVAYIARIRKQKIKRHFALTLYYNRTCDKAFTALKVNHQIKQRKRPEMKKLEEPDQGYLTSTSSEMQFQTKQSLNNSKAASLCSKRTLVPTPHTNNRKAVASYCDDQSLPIKLSVNTYHPDNFP